MQIKYKEFPKRRFGVELEVSAECAKSKIAKILEEYELFNKKPRSVKVTPTRKGWAESKNNDYWHVKYDSTCGPCGKGIDHGWEVASYIAEGLDDAVNISKAASVLGKHLSTNENCGLHIHADVSDFNSHQMGRLLMTWLRIEKSLQHICQKHRSTNIYCKSLWSKWKTLGVKNKEIPPVLFWELIKPSDYSSHNNYDKKYTLNTVGFALGQIVESHSRKTVELRLPECVLDQEHVFGWITLFLNFVHHCKNSSDCNIEIQHDILDILENLGLKGEKSFYLLSPELTSTKLWFLKKALVSEENDLINKNEIAKHIDFICQI